MNPVLVVNTHSSCSDLWKIFYDQVKKYFSEVGTIYFFTDSGESQIKRIDPNIKVISYAGHPTYRDQFLHCIKQVPEKYMIYANEDYFLYDDVDWKKILEVVEVLEQNEKLSFVKLMKGPEITDSSNSYRQYENLYALDNNSSLFYSMGAALWKTRDKEKIYELSPPMHIADKGNMPQFESHAHEICKSLNMQGCVYYEGEDKRGMYHHDSNIFPYIASALVKGKWNVKEYPIELNRIFNQYKVDYNKRGLFGFETNFSIL